MSLMGLIHLSHAHQLPSKRTSLPMTTREELILELYKQIETVETRKEVKLILRQVEHLKQLQNDHE